MPVVFHNQHSTMHPSNPSHLVFPHLYERKINPFSRFSPFLKLPIELISHVLSFLDMPDLLNCTVTCKLLSSLVHETPRLHYIIDLAKHQMLRLCSPPGMSIAAQRRLLHDREQRWHSLRWKHKIATPVPAAGSIYEFVGGVYGNGHGHGDDRRVSGSITFYQFPSTGFPFNESKPVPSWTLSGFDINIIDFSMDPSQDLLVLVASSVENTGTYYQVHLRTLSTNEPHPKAPSPILDCKRTLGPEPPDVWTSFRIQILDNYLALLIKDVFHTSAAFISIWNWRAGAQARCTIPLAMSVDDFCFLSHTEFLIVVPRGYLDIYSFTDPSVHQKYPVLIRRFGLPRLQPAHHYWYISATANPIPGTAPRNRVSTPSARPVYDRHGVSPMPMHPTSPTTSRRSSINSTGSSPEPVSPQRSESENPSDDQSLPPYPPQLPPFHPSPSDGLIACSLGTLDPTTHATLDCFVFFVRIRTLLDHPPASTPAPAPPSPASTSAVPPSTTDGSPSPTLIPLTTLAGAGSRVRTTKTTDIPWSEWGPQSTRWFNDMLSSDWQHSVSGFRTAERIVDESDPMPAMPGGGAGAAAAAGAGMGDGAAPFGGWVGVLPGAPPQANAHPKCRLRVRDYNPYLVAREKAKLEAEAKSKAKASAEGNGDGEESGEGEGADGEKKVEEGPTVRLVTEPSVLPAGNAFVEDIVSHLPYREIVTEEKVEVSDVMLDDSRILCLKRNQSGQLAGMDVLLF